MDDRYSKALEAFNSGRLIESKMLLEGYLSDVSTKQRKDDQIIEATMLLADVNVNQGLYDIALDIYFSLLENMLTENQLSEIYRKTGIIYRKKGFTTIAMQYIQKSLKIATENNSLQVKAMVSLSSVHRIRGEYDLAVELAKKALDVAIKSENELNQAESLINLGLVKYNQGELEAAIPFFNQAQLFFKKHGKVIACSKVKTMIANVFIHQGKLKEGMELYNETLNIQRKAGQKAGVAISLTAMGNIRLRTGNIQKAIDNYRRALVIEKEINNTWGQAILWKNLAGVYWLKGQKEDAKEHLDRSMRIFTGGKIRTTDYIEALRLKIQIALDDNNPHEAEVYLKKLERLAETSKIIKASHAYEKAVYLNYEGDHEGAINLLLKSYDIAYQLDLPVIKIQVLLRLSEITIKLFEEKIADKSYLRDVEQAIEYLRDLENIIHPEYGKTILGREEQGMFDRIEFYLKIVDKLASKNEHAALMIDTLVIRAMLYRTMKEYKKADQTFKRAEKLGQKKNYIKKVMDTQKLARESRLREASQQRKSLDLLQAKNYIGDIMKQMNIIRINK
ncbi:MAG: tetratricopeptide repeat protein [Candidatus Hodarchaeales archaeon]